MRGERARSIPRGLLRGQLAFGHGHRSGKLRAYVCRDSLADVDPEGALLTLVVDDLEPVAVALEGAGLRLEERAAVVLLGVPCQGTLEDRLLVLERDRGLQLAAAKLARKRETKQDDIFVVEAVRQLALSRSGTGTFALVELVAAHPLTPAASGAIVVAGLAVGGVASWFAVRRRALG